MRLDAASRKRQLGEWGWTKRNLGRSCRHWEQTLQREPGLVPIQTPSGGVPGGVSTALGHCTAPTECDLDTCAREALPRQAPGAGLSCTAWLWDAQLWEQHLAEETFLRQSLFSYGICHPVRSLRSPALPAVAVSEAKMQLWTDIPCQTRISSLSGTETFPWYFPVASREVSSCPSGWGEHWHRACVQPHTAPPCSCPWLSSHQHPQESLPPLQPWTSGAMLMPGKGFLCRHWQIPKDLWFPKIESLSYFVQIPH